MKKQIVDKWINGWRLLGKGAANKVNLPGTKVVHWLLFILLAITTTLLISFRFGKIPTEIKVGQIAPYDIKADRDYEIIDEEATAKFRAEALQNVKTTFTFDPYLSNGIAERVKAAFGEIERLLTDFLLEEAEGPGKKKKTYTDLSPQQLTELKKTWDNMLDVTVGDKVWRYLVEMGFAEELLNRINGTLDVVMSNPIVADIEVLVEGKEKGVAVRILPAEGSGGKVGEEDWDAERIEAALTVPKMKEEVKKGKYIPEILSIDEYGDRIVIQTVSGLIQPNMIYDAQETEARRQSALKSLKNVVISIQSGEAIVRGGARYEPWHVKVLEGIRKEKSERSLPLEMFGSFLLIFIIYFIVYLFGRRYVRRFAPTKVDMVFMGSLMLVMLLLLRISLFITSAIHDTVATDLPSTALTYAIPVAAGAMLVRFIINSETAALFTVVLASFAGIVVEGNVYFTAFALVSSFVAAVAISHADKRSAILQAGIITGLISAVVVLSVHLINAASVIEPLSIHNLMWYELAAFINGIGCSVFLLVVAPLAESVFGYTTDIKLLELANLNHPLLRELIIRAPGTYHHSHLVGILAESAAEAVGANPLLSRVGAYYHDIGKIKKPQYFTENMPEDVNRHEDLSPHMSALIVSAHVKDGLELAKMYKLPDIITEMIPQHHGTKKISFFYEKAMRTTDPSLQKIDEKDFKYPGPKPQTREAGILLLADAAEAAVRSLKEKNPTRIQQVVTNIIDKSFTEAQLNECDLSLKDLNEIARAFSRILSSIYHQRIEYPKEALERAADEISVFEEESIEESGDSNPSPTT